MKMKKNKQKKSNKFNKWSFQDIWGIIVLMIVFGLLFYFWIEDYGFQPEKEICNHPSTIDIPYSFDEIYMGNTKWRLIDIDTDNKKIICKWNDWRDKTKDELLIDKCKKLEYSREQNGKE